MTTNTFLANRMNLPCRCEKHVLHAKCEGSVTSQTAFYPKAFAQKVCEAIRKGCSRHEVQQELQGFSCLSDSFGNGVSCECSFGKNHEAGMSCGSCHHQTMGLLTGEPTKVHYPQDTMDETSTFLGTQTNDQGPILPDEASRAQHMEVPTHMAHAVGNMEKKVEDDIRRRLYLLHSATGHGPIRHMLQALRRRGVSSEVMRVAESFECPVCVERQRQKPRPVSTLEPLPPKWSTVAADMGTWEHPTTGQSHQFLLAIDEGSRFRVGRVLGEGKKYHVGASQFLEVFQESWCQYFGLPDNLRLDPDGTFRSKAVEEYCDRHQIFLDIIPGEAHWKLGVCENAVKGIKELMTKLVLAEPDLPVSEALSEATRTFNERETIRGYSPIQHALGRSPDMTGRLFPRAGLNSPDLLVENACGEFRRNVERMKVAETAFLDWANAQRLQRAKHSRGRPVPDYQPGDLVFVWRQQVSGQSSVKGGSFVGPVRLLAIEHRQSADGSVKPTSSAWCVRGRRLWKCSTEQLRHASSREQLLHELHGPTVETWDFHRIAAQLGGNEFLDVSKEVPTEVEWEAAQDPTRQAPEPPLWVPRHRRQGKRGPSPEPEAPMEDVEQSAAPPVRGERTARSRSPRTRPTSEAAPSVDEAFETGSAWWSAPEVQQTCSAQECVFWKNASAAIEVTVDMPVTRASSERAIADLPAFFASSFKRRAAVEVSERHLSPEEKEQFRVSKNIEVNNFIAAKAFETVPAHLLPSASQAIRMRWILSWKYKQDGTKKAKARAVLLGYQDPCYEQRATNSPTTTRQTRQLQLQLAASLKFRMKKGDVTGAFLQSREYPGELYCIPTPEICQAMGLPPESLTRVKKACYGLVDAPLEWYRSICLFFERLGLQRSWADPCCWFLLVNGDLKGLISAHVDDFLFSGDEKDKSWQQVLQAIQKEYKWSDWEQDKFVQCGVLVEQHEDFSFSLSQEKYVEDLKYINLRAHRKRDRHSPTDEWEKTQLHALLGALSWHAQQVAPHFAAEVGLMLSQVNHSSIETILKANKLMDKVKGMKGHKMRVHCIPCHELAMYVWVDAGSQNRHDGSSTQGIVLGIASKRLSHGECTPITLVAWHSQKIERKCRSPGAAEALAAINGEDALYYGRFQLAEMLGFPVDVRNVDLTVNQIPGSVVTDSRNVFDKLETETLNIRGAEKRTDLELLALKAAQIRNQVAMRWVHGEAQLANGLTKGNEFKQLELFYSMGQRWRLVEDPERASARRRKASGLAPLETRTMAADKDNIPDDVNI